MNRKSILALLLASLMLMSAVSCGDAGSDETTADTSSAQTDAVETEPEITFESVAAGYQDRDYGGYTFRVGVRDVVDWQTMDVIAEEVTGEVINDAVYNRNVALEDAMNIKVTEIRHDVPTDQLKQAVTPGTDDYDTVTDGLASSSPLVAQNMLLDYRNISTIHADQPYWDPQIYDDCAVMGRTFFMTGDISIMDNKATWCMLFNKDMIIDHGMESPYDLVNDGKWTLDKMDEMAAVALTDVDGDGKWTEADTYGFVTEGYNNMALWSCAGFKIMENDAEGLPYYTYSSEASIDTLTRIMEIQYAEHSNMGSKSTVTGGGMGEGATREKQFANGNALFYYAGMINITLFRDFDTDFGVIPAPKRNEEQEQYWSNYSYYNFTIYVIPTTCPDAEMVGDIMDAMANLSMYSLTPAYYNQTLIGKSTRDEESEPMIELILNTRNFDLGIIFDTGAIRTTICGFTSPDNIASTLASKEKTANTDLEKFIENVSALQQ